MKIDKENHPIRKSNTPQKPNNVMCVKCKHWLARINTKKIKNNYVCFACLRGETTK